MLMYSLDIVWAFKGESMGSGGSEVSSSGRFRFFSFMDLVLGKSVCF